MKEKIEIKTLVKGENKLSRNNYVRGYIAGVAEAFCGDIIFRYPENEELGYIIVTNSTYNEYLTFANIIDLKFKDLCEFNYEGEL